MNQGLWLSPGNDVEKFYVSRVGFSKSLMRLRRAASNLYKSTLISLTELGAYASFDEMTVRKPYCNKEVGWL